MPNDDKIVWPIEWKLLHVIKIFNYVVQKIKIENDKNFLPICCNGNFSGYSFFSVSMRQKAVVVACVHRMMMANIDCVEMIMTFPLCFVQKKTNFNKKIYLNHAKLQSFLCDAICQ